MPCLEKKVQKETPERATHHRWLSSIRQDTEAVNRGDTYLSQRGLPTYAELMRCELLTN